VSETKHTNELIHETSPYLLHHAHNPVNWFPWGNEALAKARDENKAILLSIGYSACHWCHVMEHESFENEEIAKLMNENFVNIKVDREERPDLDQIYMNAVQMMTGHGGWPMTMFLTPDAVPFYGGTYFPPTDRYNMPGFPRILLSVAEAYRSQPDQVIHTATTMLGELRRVGIAEPSNEILTTELLDGAYRRVASNYDATNGGFGGAPKFPPSMTLEFFLHIHHRTRSAEPLEIVQHTCRQMAAGGIYDHLGGGFHRYSVDAHWLVPHFEKMLYDNAQLATLYLHGWQAFGDAEYRQVCEETLDYLLREMRDPPGGFHSAQDADSEREEGKFFVWTADEIRAALGPDADTALAYWGVDRGSNFEGSKSILWVPDESAPEKIAKARAKLYAIREQRVHPACDDKVLAAWNGLAARALADAGAALRRADYVAAAMANADVILTEMRDGDGRLVRTWKDGQAKLKAYLEDYAMVAAALVSLYEATFQRRWLDEARRLADDILRLFWDDAIEGFYDTGSDHERLIVRPRNLSDNAVPSGSSVAIETLLRLKVLTGEARYETKALAGLRAMADLMSRHPTGFGRARKSTRLNSSH